MLKQIRVARYKSFQKATAINLRRLTILIGKNNSGKTAIARIPLLLRRASGSEQHPNAPVLPLRIGAIDYGSAIQDIVYGKETHGSLALGITTHSEEFDDRLDFAVQLRQSISHPEDSFVSSVSLNNLPNVAWTQSDTGGVTYGDDVDGVAGVWPRYADRELNIEVQRVADRIRYSLSTLSHLTSIREPIRAVYEARSLDHSTYTNGFDAPYILYNFPEVLRRVSDAYESALGLPRLEIAADGGAFQLVLASPSGGNALARAGQGSQQAMPVATHLALLASSSQPGVLVIEEPELHLHPAAHAGFATLAVDAITGNSNSQVIVETHSEVFLLRLRRLVAEGRLSPDDVNILWFEKTENASEVTEILIEPDGTVPDWPAGIFAEDLEEVRAIVQAGAS